MSGFGGEADVARRRLVRDGAIQSLSSAVAFESRLPNQISECTPGSKPWINRWFTQSGRRLNERG
jgi:hypothetical protein